MPLASFGSVDRPQHESNRALDWIEETTETRCRDVALDIAFSRCPEEVVHLDSAAESVLPYVPRARQRKIECIHTRKTSGPVPRPHEFLEFVHSRPRKSRSDLDDRGDVPLTGQPDGAPNQQPMRHIGGNKTVF